MNSFASQVKQELSEINNLKDKSLVRSELLGYLITSEKNEFTTENQYNINRYGKLLNNVGENDYSIVVKGNKFTIKPKRKIEVSEEIQTEEQFQALMRGSFLAKGSITNPKTSYHLEIIFSNPSNASLVLNLLKNYSFEFSMVERNYKSVIYISSGDVISRFLAFIGANKSMLNFEETRVLKEVGNNVNRIVNFETANLNKTISSAVKQIEDIKLIKSKKKFGILSEGEQELAELRLANPEVSLTTLGEMATPPLTKSGVAHRMANITKLAKELRK